MKKMMEGAMTLSKVVDMSYLPPRRNSPQAERMRKIVVLFSTNTSLQGIEPPRLGSDHGRGIS